MPKVPAKPSTDASAAAPPQPTWGERLFRPRWLIVAAVLSTLPVVGPWFVRQLPDLEQRSEYRLPFAQLQLEPSPPEAVPSEFLDQVRQKAGLDEQLSLLDPNLPHQLAGAFAAHPWVEQVLRVRNMYPATVTVELKYRRPVALVHVSEGFYAVDSQGVLLPPGDFQIADTQRYITVQGIRTQPSAAAGHPWGDPAVAAAAQLADFLGVRWKDLGLTTIVAPPTADRKTDLDDLTFELLSTGGTRILWGRVPGSTHPGELAASQKLGRLEKYLAEFGGFDRPNGPYEIDIRHWQEITRRPLANPHANTANGGRQRGLRN